MATPERYITIAEFKARYSGPVIDRLADTDNDGSANDPPILQAISDAEDLIDGYISTAYVTPVTVVPLPNVLKQFAARVAMYNLSMRNQSQKIPEAVKDDYDSVLTTLKQVQKGEYVIAGAANRTSDGTYTGPLYTRSSKEHSDRYFNDDFLKRMR